MDLAEALRTIKGLFHQDCVQETNHEKERKVLRDISIEVIKDTYKNKKIVGILEQGPDVYKLWFVFSTDKDLNLVVRIEPYQIRLITIFECDTKKRLRPR